MHNLVAVERQLLDPFEHRRCPPEVAEGNRSRQRHHRATATIVLVLVLVLVDGGLRRWRCSWRAISRVLTGVVGRQHWQRKLGVVRPAFFHDCVPMHLALGTNFLQHTRHPLVKRFQALRRLPRCDALGAQECDFVVFVVDVGHDTAQAQLSGAQGFQVQQPCQQVVYWQLRRTADLKHALQRDRQLPLLEKDKHLVQQDARIMNSF